MDYPKSVPGIGLVNGRFVDENVVSGTPGSLIPATWGNSVTQEMLAVIASAGLVPTEADNGQLLKALQVITAKASPMLSLVTNVSGSKVLVPDELGLVLVNGGVDAITITLPASDAMLGVRDVIVRRTDNSGNRLKVQCTGTDKVRFHTHLSTSGYPFLVLMGAGDWWHLRSDATGSWWPVGRFDGSALGRPVFETTLSLGPGGYGALNGAALSRTEWPWLWDHAQQSGMLIADSARGGKEGSWTSGDGVSTFRLPEGRGAFLRILAEGASIDIGRLGGSTQQSSNLSHSHGPSNSSPGFMSNEYPVVQAYHSASSTGLASYAGEGRQMATTGLSGGVESRPYNIGYPGRIKLI